MKMTYKHTKYASYIGYITQAIINNLPPLLFIIFNEELGISMPSLWRWVKAGKMPKPVKLSPRVAAFSTAEINSWLEAKSESDH